jgi:beta-mannosidase
MMQSETTTGPAAAIPGVASLVDTALIRDFAPGEGAEVGAATPGHPSDGWVPASVPGDVHRALVAAGRIEHPFYDRNEDLCAWMEEREWWYRMRFDGPSALRPEERLRLVFHGLDTFATVYLNGEVVGSHESMFRAASFDVSAAVLSGRENLLAVRFDPPLRHVGPPLPGQWAPFDHDRVWMRKGQYGFGWDWGPRLPTIGVWSCAASAARR